MFSVSFGDDTTVVGGLLRRFPSSLRCLTQRRIVGGARKSPPKIRPKTLADIFRPIADTPCKPKSNLYSLVESQVHNEYDLHPKTKRMKVGDKKRDAVTNRECKGDDNI